MRNIYHYFLRSNNNLLSKMVIKVLLSLLLCIIISISVQAQSTIDKKTWGLDAIELKEVTRTRAEVPVKYIEVKEIIECIFQKIELKNENKCVLWDYYKNSHDASYSSNDSELIIKHDEKEIIYKYSVNDKKLTLRRNFNAGNVSGVLVEYNIVLQFSLQN